MDQTHLDVSDSLASGQEEPPSSEPAAIPQPIRKARAPTEIFVLIADPETAIELEKVHQAFIATDQLNTLQSRADQILECYAAKHITRIYMLKDNVMPDTLDAKSKGNVGLIGAVIGGILMELPSTRAEMSYSYSLSLNDINENVPNHIYALYSQWAKERNFYAPESTDSLMEVDAPQQTLNENEYAIYNELMQSYVGLYTELHLQWHEMLYERTKQYQYRNLTLPELEMLKRYYFLLRWCVLSTAGELLQRVKERKLRIPDLNDRLKTATVVNNVITQLDRFTPGERMALQRNSQIDPNPSMRALLRQFFGEMQKVCTFIAANMKPEYITAGNGFSDPASGKPLINLTQRHSNALCNALNELRRKQIFDMTIGMLLIQTCFIGKDRRNTIRM